MLRADCAENLRACRCAAIDRPPRTTAASGTTDVKVWNGGDVLATTLDLKAIEPTPAPTTQVRAGRSPPITVHFVLREGEKACVVKASFNLEEAGAVPSS